MDTISTTCPQCEGLGRVPAEGHTKAELRAEIEGRMIEGRRRLARIEARRVAREDAARVSARG
jgi:hypothetical protein